MEFVEEFGLSSWLLGLFDDSLGSEEGVGSNRIDLLWRTLVPTLHFRVQCTYLQPEPHAGPVEECLEGISTKVVQI